MSEEEEYYREQVPVVMERIQIMTILGACILALKHPKFPDGAAAMTRDICRQLRVQVDRYVPGDTKAEWDRVLWPGKEGGAG